MATTCSEVYDDDADDSSLDGVLLWCRTLTCAFRATRRSSILTKWSELVSTWTMELVVHQARTQAELRLRTRPKLDASQSSAVFSRWCMHASVVTPIVDWPVVRR